MAPFRMWSALIMTLVIAPSCRHSAASQTPVGTNAEVVIPVPTETNTATRPEEPLPERTHSESQDTSEEPPSIGVPDCDEFLAKYHRCALEQTRDPAHAHLLEMEEHLRTTFRAMRESAEPSVVAKTCRQIDETMGDAMRSLGCSW